MKANHSKTKTIVRVIAFLLIVALVYGALTEVLSVNNTWDMRHIRGFYREPKNSLDVVLIGASELYTGFCSPLAWQQHGFTSYSLCVSSMPGCLYHSMLTETMRRQTPKTVVVEINGFLFDFSAEDTETGLRKWIDNMPMSANKVRTILSSVPRDQWSSYFFRLEKYHTNWNEPTVWAEPAQQYLTLLRTGYSLTKALEIIPKVQTGDCPPKNASLSADNVQRLRSFCELAHELGVENVLFVRFPHRAGVTDPTVLTRLGDIVGEYGYDFLDCDRLFADIGLERDGDFFDNEHLNVFGMETFTDWFGQYLTEHYDLSSSQGAAVKTQWARCAQFVEDMLPYCEQKTPSDAGTLHEYSPEFSAYR